MDMQRTVVTELLDLLDHDHPEAVASRRDINFINKLMGNPGWWTRTLDRHLRPDDRVLEIGAGDGLLAAMIRNRFPGLRVDGLDTCPAPAGWPQAATWHRVDVRDFDQFGTYTVIIVNLLLHQLQDDELRRLGQRMQMGPRLVAACEPVRSWLHLTQFSLLAPFVNRVTRHDAVASLRAGFTGNELSILLGLDKSGWRTKATRSVLGAHRLVAEKCPQP